MTPPPGPVATVRFASNDQGFAVGPGLDLTTDGGRTWTPEPVPGGGRVAALELRPGAAFLATLPLPGQPDVGARLYRWNPRGPAATWTHVNGADLPLDRGPGAGAILALSPDSRAPSVDLLGTVPGAGISLSPDGHAWHHTASPCPPTSPTPVDIDEGGNGTEVLCGNTGHPGLTLLQAQGSGFAVEHERLPTGVTPDALDNFVLLTSGQAANIYALSGSGGQTRPRLSVPGSATWSTLQLRAGGGGRDIALTTGGAGRLYLSRDGATHWYAVDLTRRALPPACAAHDLMLSAGQPGAALGNTVQPVYLQNTSSKLCVLAGYPTVTVTGGHPGAGLTFHDAPDSYIVSPRRDTGPALLPPGHSATVFLSGTDNPVGHATDDSCSATTSMTLGFPGTGTVTSDVRLSDCGDISISPVQPGIAAPNGVA